MNGKKKKCKFIAFYSTNKERGPSSLASTTKLNYIFSCLNSLGYNVEVLSESSTSYIGKVLTNEIIHLREDLKVKYPIAFPGKNIFQKVIRKFFNSFLIKKFLRQNLSNGDTVFIYHSVTDHKYLSKIIKMKKLNVILEVEEIYGDVSNNTRLRKKELVFFDFANGYLFPTQLMNKTINTKNKPSSIIHGTYNVELEYGEKFNDGHIHCVYAGTFDPRKGGAQAAIESALFLDKKYVIHILGFGSKNDITSIKNRISEINESGGAHVFFEGSMSGEQYLKFLQKCDIGLSTQNPKGDYNDSSFPSKILSYISNGLRVVSVRIPVVELSAISSDVYYTKSNSGMHIADAIKKIDLTKKYSGRGIISKLNESFIADFNSFLEKVLYE